MKLHVIRRRGVNALFVLALLGVCGGGCGSGTEPSPVLEKLTPASGTVTQNGEPVAGANVMFLPDPDSPGSGAEVATGVTDAQGRYELITALPGVGIEQCKGAVPAKYVVVLSRILMPDGSPVPAETTDADAMALDAKESIPPTYSDVEQSTLKAEVVKEQANYDFKLE